MSKIVAIIGMVIIIADCQELINALLNVIIHIPYLYSYLLYLCLHITRAARAGSKCDDNDTSYE